MLCVLRNVDGRDGFLRRWAAFFMYDKSEGECEGYVITAELGEVEELPYKEAKEAWHIGLETFERSVLCHIYHTKHTEITLYK